VLWRRNDPEAVALVEECDAFLAGCYVELCEARGTPVAVWAWMNLLAHGTEDQLRAGIAPRPNAGPWRHARGFLAGELLDLADAGRLGLPEFQRDVLAPLELDVMSCPGAGRWQPGSS
jgi:hypothetical protein